ncbi:ABC transporter [Sphingomonas oleivorans]|uniref:ABC transporter n=2 Tax=Sphingomonas oleivorans TaxID=1735121 RepID=A0A2T5FZE6_9SPHN|nr:ABC transporter [Sphingomonas oleivorans]
MMSSITLSDLSWATPEGRAVLNGTDLRFGRERAGLVGRNGVGKTTLLQIIAGERQPGSGRVTVDGTVTMLRQAVQAQPGETIADLFGATDALAMLRRAEAGEATIDELADADWTIEERIAASLARVELGADPAAPLHLLSGGQRTRASLAAAIFAEPDFLLLDEPTNNLDRDGRDAVARLVEGWNAGLIVVSHDRELLQHMDAIVELTTLGATRYGGNWSHYRARKAIELEAAEHDLAHAQRRQAEIQRRAQIADERKVRRDAAGARKAARGDMPRILMGARKNAAEASGGSGQRLSERISNEAADAVAAAKAKVEILQTLSIILPTTNVPAGRVLVDMQGVAGGYDAKAPLFRDLDLKIAGPERIAIVGPNGSGKSTLVKLVTGGLEPLAGRVKMSAATTLIDQHVAFLEPRASILENFRRLNPGSDENACRSILAGFLFRADAALQQVDTLSGGQMLRAGLACRLGGTRPPELLVLDEPTNHLDLDSVHAIEAALEAYDGALLVVSHDEGFLENIAITRRVELGREAFEGNSPNCEAVGA